MKYLSWGLVWAAGMSITQAEVSGKAGEGWPGCVGEALGTWLFSRSYKGWVALDVLALELWLGSLFPYLLHPLNWVGWPLCPAREGPNSRFSSRSLI